MRGSRTGSGRRLDPSPLTRIASFDEIRPLPASGRAIAYDIRSVALVCLHIVMPGLVPGIHVVLSMPDNVDGRDKPGHDDVETVS
ncbi:hypothetical protein SSBR45G_67450 [Bradyrhizobium sp. SSBR45G]|nr:hypothetical protein SSBR45G_67450 [Bradyrhizobium sp. SSBR45G]GLH89315.1 hypothetical protein SSBR45R_67760 [Bradyrhizobium sp. SSBR45R]